MNSDSFRPTNDTTLGQKKAMHVIIAGGGIVGLTIAQGCRENGIRYTVFEQGTQGQESQCTRKKCLV